MKVTNDHTVRCGGVMYLPSSQTEQGFNDIPEGKGLDSLLAAKAVEKYKPHRHEEEHSEKTKAELAKEAADKAAKAKAEAEAAKL